MENGEPTKTLLTIMFKSVAADYNDVIAMVPTTKIDSAEINRLFTMFLCVITPLGYTVVASLVHGHSSNVKFYTKELCENIFQPYITNPQDPQSKLFLTFDTTHVFKCVYNNFQSITKDNLGELEGLFAKIIDWVFEWQSSHKMSVETFKTFKQTTKTSPPRQMPT